MTDTTTDPRKVAADIALAEANARKAAAEADAAELDATVPDFPTEIPAGTLTAPDKAPPIATAAAYRALEVAAKAIAEKIKGQGVQNLWIVPDGTYQAAIDTHAALEAQLDRLVKVTEEAVEKTAGSGDSFAPALPALAVAALPMLASLFSTSRAITTSDVTVGFPAAAALVATACKTEGRKVDVWGMTDPGAAGVTDKLGSLKKARDDLDRALVDARASAGPSAAGAGSVAEAEAWRSALEHAANLAFKDAGDFVQKVAEASKAAATQRADTLRRTTIISAGEQLLKLVDDFMSRIEAGGVIPAQAALGARLKDAHVLVVQPAYAGGETQYEDVKLKRDRALHLGSCVVTWYLIAPDHELSASGVEAAHASANTHVGIPDVTWSVA